MDEIITRGINTVNESLKSWSEQYLYVAEPELKDIPYLLNRLLEPNLPRISLARLFCRWLNRLMDYNDPTNLDFWDGLYQDILCLLEEPTSKRYKDREKYFLKRMEFESELEQRELHFQQKKIEQKTLQQLLTEHKTFFEEYLRKCILLHSKVQVHGLIENVNDLCKDYGLTELSHNLERKNYLNEKLNSIEINLDCSNRYLQLIDSTCFTSNSSYNRTKNNPNNFLPTDEQQIKNITDEEPSRVLDALKNNRWMVILGDPGSAKTTLLRWITCVFAENVANGCEVVNFEEDGHIPIRITVRVPILIRIGEFAEWLNRNKKKTLIDYIGEHTWFSQCYCSSKDWHVLRELVNYGHAMILLDGLDEIAEVGQRKEIVDHVRSFMDEYIRTPDFISPFDNGIFDMRHPFGYRRIVEMQLPIKPGGNQIVVTSRCVGYQFSPLTGSVITHHRFSLMDHKQANKFVKKWMTQAERGIVDILVNQELTINENSVEILWRRRCDAVEAMFEGGSELLMSNPSLLSLICTVIFQQPDKFRPKYRVEVYDYAIQAALNFWTSKQSNFSKQVLTNFLIDLATYLHLNSPSGLIDEFDTEQLCCLVLQQQGLKNDRIKLHEYAKNLISLLSSNIGIVGEKGLQIFGFLHLSFQEYFVALSFVKGTSIEEVATRILSFVINPRFRESLLLSLGWISWKWPFEKYDNLCKLLFTMTLNYAVPFGTLLFFDAINDLQRLPTNSVIFIALNNLLDHPSDFIRTNYLISNLSKLPNDIIIEWMGTRLKNNKCLLKFCQSFLMRRDRYSDIIQFTRHSISPVVCQQLWSFYNRSLSTDFIIDQILRRIMMKNDISFQVFNKDLSLYFLSHNMSGSSIHPLILSVIVVLCGGIYLKKDEDTASIDFSLKYMHRESSIMTSILEYLDNNEPHSIKVLTLIQQYESVLQKSLSSNTSVDIVDTFIALICLQGVSQPLIYQKYDGYQALLIALDQLKQKWFYLQRSVSVFGTHTNVSLIKSEMETIMNVYFSYADYSDKQRVSFSIACASAWKKLGLQRETEMFSTDSHFSKENDCNFQYQPEFIHLINKNKFDEIAEIIHSDEISQQELHLLRILLPQYLQKLYYCFTTISSAKVTNPLPLFVFLSQYLLHLEDPIYDNFEACVALLMLQPLLKKHKLENYVFAVFWDKYNHRISLNQDRKELLKTIKNLELLCEFGTDRWKDYELLINVERERIFELKKTIQNEEKDDELFAASISLARLFQAQYHSQKSPRTKQITSLDAQNEEIHSAIINIHDPILRTIALSIILHMNDSLLINEQKQNQLRYEIIILLQFLLPDLPLLKSTLLFVQCHIIRQFFPASFKCMTKIIGEKLNDTSKNELSQDQEATFVALRSLDNPDLTPYLSEFAKRTTNLSNLLHFNSTIFHQYFKDIISFDSSNTSLLSSMYLAELAFDVQILKMYTRNDQKNDIQPLKEVNQLLSHLRVIGNKMTFQIATWITNYLPILNEKQINRIIEGLSSSSMIESKALSVIEKWLDYRMDKVLNILAYYAALHLTIKGSNISGLIDIINEMIRIDHQCRLRELLGHMFASQHVNLTDIHQILVTLQKNIHYLSKISISINRRDIFKFILDLELKRVTSNAHRSSETLARPFLLMIKGCSEDIQLYLLEYLRIFIDTHCELKNTIKDEYVAVIVKWFIETFSNNNFLESGSMELTKHILLLLHAQRFPQLQKTIVNALSSLFFLRNIEKVNIFIQDNGITNLEKVICLSNTYRDDVLSICLLAYGNYLLLLPQFQIIESVSDELNSLFDRSPSEIISIRAGFCLIFSQHSVIKYDTIMKWFSDKLEITPEKRYNILLQQALYKVNNWSLLNYENEHTNRFVFEEDYECQRYDEICDHIETYSDELIDTFVMNLYTYLCEQNDYNYLSDPTPNYINIALKFSENNLDKFRSAVEQSSFGEKTFKAQLNSYFKKNLKDREESAKLYMIFGIVTVDLIDMLEQLEYDNIDSTFWDRINLKQVSDRDTVERLFQVLKVKTYYKKLESRLHVVRSIAGTRDFSLVDMYQKVSLINTMSYDDTGYDLIEYDSEKLIFELLLDLSCIETKPRSYPEIKLCTENYINEEFDREIMTLNKKSTLFLEADSFY